MNYVMRIFRKLNLKIESESLSMERLSESEEQVWTNDLFFISLLRNNKSLKYKIVATNIFVVGLKIIFSLETKCQLFVIDFSILG